MKLIIFSCNQKYRKQNTALKKEILNAAEWLGSKIINYAGNGTDFVNI